MASGYTFGHSLLANHMRWFFSCGAKVLHQALRMKVLVHTALVQAQFATVIIKVFKMMCNDVHTGRAPCARRVHVV